MLSWENWTYYDDTLIVCDFCGDKTITKPAWLYSDDNHSIEVCADCSWTLIKAHLCVFEGEE